MQSVAATAVGWIRSGHSALATAKEPATTASAVSQKYVFLMIADSAVNSSTAWNKSLRAGLTQLAGHISHMNAKSGIFIDPSSDVKDAETAAPSRVPKMWGCL